VQAGQDPRGVVRRAGGVVRTYCNDTVVPVPRAGSADEDERLIRETGRRVAESYVTHGVPNPAARVDGSLTSIATEAR
jgi:hypothetical protein